MWYSVEDSSQCSIVVLFTGFSSHWTKLLCSTGCHEWISSDGTLLVIYEGCVLTEYDSLVLIPNYLEFILTNQILPKVNRDIERFIIKRELHILKCKVSMNCFKHMDSISLAICMKSKIKRKMCQRQCVFSSPWGFENNQRCLTHPKVSRLLQSVMSCAPPEDN